MKNVNCFEDYGHFYRPTSKDNSLCFNRCTNVCKFCVIQDSCDDLDTKMKFEVR